MRFAVYITSLPPVAECRLELEAPDLPAALMVAEVRVRRRIHPAKLLALTVCEAR